MPDKPTRKSTHEEWFMRGEHDLQSARLLLEQGGPTDTISVLLQQVAEKHLKGYLLTRGWKLQKTHDLEVLVSEAITHDRSFDQFLDFARIVTAYYLEDRYPPGPPSDYPRDEIAKAMMQVQKLVTKIREGMG